MQIIIDTDSRTLVVDAAGGGWIAEQAALSPLALATRLQALLGQPEALGKAAAIAKTLGQPDAVARLADLSEKLAVRKKS